MTTAHPETQNRADVGDIAESNSPSERVYVSDGFVVRFPDFKFPKSETAAENSEDDERRARLFKEAVEGAREDAKAMRTESK